MIDLRRRQFLHVAACSAASLPGLALAGPPAPRRLRLAHLHTGETLDVRYAEGGAHIPGALAQVERFLRDFRTGDTHPIDPALLDTLHALQSGFDGAGRLLVVSGYRSPKTNAMLRSRGSGVAKRSLHMQGRAIDVRLEGVPTAELHARARALGLGGVGYYPDSNFIHVDTGRPRFW